MDGLTSPDTLPWLLAALVAVLAVAVVALALASGATGPPRPAREEARAESADLRRQLDAIERRMAEPTPPRATEGEFVITRLGEDHADGAPPQRIEGRLFADIVARETLVKAASWTHGVRRALAPETRNRIRFHMKQEAKRARKERRAEMKEALRVYRARQRNDSAARSNDEDAA